MAGIESKKKSEIVEKVQLDECILCMQKTQIPWHYEFFQAESTLLPLKVKGFCSKTSINNTKKSDYA